MDRRAHDEDAEREETPRRARAEVFRSCILAIWIKRLPDGQCRMVD